MTDRGDAGRRRRLPAGDPQLRVLLLLIVGGLLIYATFHHPSDGKKTDERVYAEIKADMASYRPEPVVVTKEHEAAYATRLHPSVVIAATMAVPISDLSAPGALNCAIGYSVTNNSSVDISNFLFSITYTSPQGRGSSVENISVPAFSTQGLTPINAVRGRCEGVTGAVNIEHCGFSNGNDCSQLAHIISNGAIPLARAP